MMRGGKSLLILLVVALGLGAYIYFVESKKDPDASTEKKEKLFPIEQDKIEEIEVRAASGDVTRLKKSGTTWQIVAPQTLEADPAEVNNLLTSLETLEAQRTIDENPSSVSAYGLDPVRFSIAIRAAGETAMRRLNVGNKTAAGADLYARLEGQLRLIVISAHVEDSLNRTTFDLREKAVLKFAREAVDSLTIEAGGTPAVALTKKESEWRLTKPVAARADFGSVDSIVSRVSQTKMKAITTPDGTAELKKYGLDKPQAVATIGAGSTRATLAIGGKVDETTVYARDLSRPMVFTVESSLLEELKKKLDDLRVKDVFEFRTFTAMSIDLSYGGQTYTFEKQKASSDQSTTAEVWKQTKPAAKDVDQTKFTDLLSSLSNLRADKFADNAPASGEDLVVSAKFGDPSSPKQERVTLRKASGSAYAIISNEPGAAVVPLAELDKALAAFKELTGLK